MKEKPSEKQGDALLLTPTEIGDNLDLEETKKQEYNRIVKLLLDNGQLGAIHILEGRLSIGGTTDE